MKKWRTKQYTHPGPENRYIVSFVIITRYNDRTPEQSKIWDRLRSEPEDPVEEVEILFKSSRIKYEERE